MSSPLATLQNGTGSRHKFPFIIVPVSTTTGENTDSRTTVLNTSGRGPQNRVDGSPSHPPNPAPGPTPNSYHPHPPPVSSSQEFLPQNQKRQENCGNISSKRAVAASEQMHKQLNAQFSPSPTTIISPGPPPNGYQTLIQTLSASASAHDQLRGPGPGPTSVKHLYPNRSATSTTIPPDKSVDLPKNPITLNGVRITEEFYREILRSPTPTPGGQIQNQKPRPQLLKSRPPIPGSSPNNSNYPNQTLSRENLSTNRKLERKIGIPPGEPCMNIRDGPSMPMALPHQCLTYPGAPPPIQYQVDTLAKQLKAKDNEISMLKNDLKAVKKSLADSNSNVVICQTLTKGLAKVEKQLEDLEEKVEFYDGDMSRKCLAVQRKSSLTSLNSEKSFDHSNSALWLPDFDRIIRTTRELNALVGHDTIELCYNSGGATFKQSQAITLTLFKNGIMLEDSPKIFKSFASPSTIQFLQDIYEGFFPSELQNKYPGGVTLIVDDKRQVIYTKEGACFAGKGEKLTEPYRRQIVPRFIPGMKYLPIKSSNLPSTATSKESLASTSTFSSTKSESSYEELPDLIPSHLKSFQNRKLGSRNSVVLKLKNMVTGELYKFRTSIGATIQNLLDHLEENLRDRDRGDESDKSESDDEQNPEGKKFELINILPFGIFAIPGVTLKDYGITTNTLLYFRPT